MRRLTMGVIAVLVLAVLFVVLCTFVKRPYEKVLLVRFGTLIEEKQQVRIGYNWFFKLPTDRVVRIDTRLHLYPGSLLQLTTAKKEPISVQTFAAWRITDAKAFYKKTTGSDEKAMSIMAARLQELVGDKIGKHTLDDLFSADPKSPVKTGEIEDEIAKEASEGSPDGKTPGLKEMGLEIAEVGFSRIAFPPSNTGPVYERMVAELNEQAINYQSTADAEVKRILSEGQKTAEQTRSDAQVEAQKIRGEGDAEALRILADVNKTPSAREFYQYWKSLDYLKTSLAKNTILVLSTDSAFLKSLFLSPELQKFTQPEPAGAATSGAAGASAGPAGAATLVPRTPVKLPVVPAQR